MSLGLAGPDEDLLGPNGRRVFQTKEAVLDDEEARMITEEAWEVISTGRMEDNRNRESRLRAVRTELTNDGLVLAGEAPTQSQLAVDRYSL